MADNVAVTAGSGTTVAADEVSDGTLGSCKVQFVKLMDGTLDGTTKVAAGANGLAVDVKAAVISSVTLPTGAGTVGTGRKTCATAGSAEQFSSQACKFVLITGEEDNTDIVVIGGSGVVAALATRQGIPLSPLQQVRLELSNLNLLYIDAVVSTEGVTFAYFS